MLSALNTWGSFFSFANPAAGAWALLAIPAILAIHFLQTPSRPVVTSTLFLLERLAPESTSGRRFERLRQSLPLWLQLLCALLLAGMIAQPRWLLRDSAQTVLVLLDSSTSLRAFSKTLNQTVPLRLQTLAQSASHTEWLLLETDPTAERLYAGPRLEELVTALHRWQPKLGTHDTQPALRAALALLKGRGIVVFVTDRKTELPPGVECLAIGHPLENVGICGAEIGETGWSALISNFGTQPQRRSWHLETEQGQPIGEQHVIELPPGGSQTVRGDFPCDALRLVLNGDDFSLDDVMPMVRPRSKPMRLRVAMDETESSWLEPFLRCEPALERLPAVLDNQSASKNSNVPNVQQPIRPDLFIGWQPASTALSANTPAILFAKGSKTQSAPQPGGWVIAGRHPLMTGLPWDGLQCSYIPLVRQPTDSVLLWQGERPLILLRGRQLVFAFDPAASNAPRFPAFVLLLHRFLETVRTQTPAPETANFETNQAFEWAVAPGKTELRRAPCEPVFFEIGPVTARLKGATHFSDPRQSDFRTACSLDTLNAAALRQRERHSRQDPFTPLWLILLGLLMSANWIYTEARRK